MKVKKFTLLIPIVCLGLLVMAALFAVGCGGSVDEETTSTMSVQTTTLSGDGTETTTDGTDTTVTGPVETLKIGAIICMTGWMSALDVQNLNEALILVDMINEEWGGVSIGGTQYMIELVAEDCQTDMAGTATAAHRLVYDEQVKFFIGPGAFFSSAVTPIADPNKVLHVLYHCAGTPGEMGPDVPYGFLTDGGTVAHANSALSFLKEHFPDAKRIAVVVPTGAVSDELVNAMATALPNFGMEQVGEWVTYADDVVDFTPYAQKVYSMDADAVFIPAGTNGHLKNLAKGLRALGYEKPVGGDVFATTSEFVDFLGEEDANNVFYRTFIPDAPGNTEIANDLLRRSIAKYGEDTMRALQVANSLYVLLNVMEAAGSTDPEVVKEVWEGLEEVDTVYGKGIMGCSEYYGIDNHAVIVKLTYAYFKDGETICGWYGGQSIP
ncbi:MAG: ABC transporter substrate-binding protein [Armatimonadetes bacterium]|nr:ABC transporter substrate-binding protein [Armatimonadota bacterium]